MTIKENEIVTITAGQYQIMSNTYIVARKLIDECVLIHPIAPDCCIIKKDSELNIDFPQSQNSVELCLLYAKVNSNILGHSMSADLDSLCYYFVIKKTFTPKQRHDLANILGKIASVVFASNASGLDSKTKTVPHSKHLNSDPIVSSLMARSRSVLAPEHSHAGHGSRTVL